MKVSYNWLKEFVPFPHSPDELATVLSGIGLAVDGIEPIAPGWSGVVVGQVLTYEPVAGSDHLAYCEVNTGSAPPLKVVCGAPNVAVGQRVPLAVPGAELPGGLKISERRLRGLVSQGMICSERELGISDEKSGIMVLPDDCRIGAPLESYLRRRDWVLDLDVTFNRPDCLSHLGIARELAAAVNLPLTMPSADVDEADEPAADWVSVEIISSSRCPRYTARIVSGAVVKPSPLWMQERLRSVGLRTINNVVDVTNYLLIEMGHPLHAFDYNLIGGKKIIVREAGDGEKFTTLDDKVHQLTSADLLIADQSRGIAIAGVMGGLNSEINVSTRNVLIECAYFEPGGIRATSRRLGIVTESSRRFERGVDPDATVYVARRAAKVMRTLSGGMVLRGEVDAYPAPRRGKSITLRSDRVNRLLATQIPATEMERILSALGCTVSAGETLLVVPPSWRGDLEAEIDLVEEIARHFGYDRIAEADASHLPLQWHHRRERERRQVERFKRAMVALGLYEAVTPVLTAPADIARLGLLDISVKLINPLSEDLSRLRPNLLPGLLRSAERNINAGVGDIRLFEWGRCFKRTDDVLTEKSYLGGLIIGGSQPPSWAAVGREFGIFDLKGAMFQFARMIRLDLAQVIYYDIPAFLSYGGTIRCANGDGPISIGWFGRLAPEIAAGFGIEPPVWCFEFNGDRLLELAGRIPRHQPLPRFPAARRDLAFLVDAALPSGELEEVLLRHGGELLESIQLFDLFRGGALPTNKKSLAYHLNFRSLERTLEDAEVDGIIAKMVAAAEAERGAQLRKL